MGNEIGGVNGGENSFRFILGYDAV